LALVVLLKLQTEAGTLAAIQPLAPLLLRMAAAAALVLTSVAQVAAAVAGNYPLEA
jgi:hypothetical protein